MTAPLTLENIMKAWQDMTQAERLRCEYSDLHKEVFGRRPDYTEVDAWDDNQLALEYSRLVTLLEEL